MLDDLAGKRTGERIQILRERWAERFADVADVAGAAEIVMRVLRAMAAGEWATGERRR